MKKICHGSSLVMVTLMLALFCSAAPSWGSTYYLYNQWGGTWHDVNKNYNDDSLMCWAASASNILDWGEWGTATYSTEKTIFKNFKTHWTNNRGWQSWAWQWWLNGGTFNYGYAYVNVAGAGKYWSSNSFYSYYTTASGSGEMARMDSLMNLGYGISLVVGPGTTNQHAITAWGFDYTLSGTTKKYTAVYITDSDDNITALRKINLLYTNSRWQMTNYSGGWYIQGVYAFLRRPGAAKETITSLGSGGTVPAGLTAPIMPTWTLLATGLLLLLTLRLRRRIPII